LFFFKELHVNTDVQDVTMAMHTCFQEQSTAFVSDSVKILASQRNRSDRIRGILSFSFRFCIQSEPGSPRQTLRGDRFRREDHVLSSNPYLQTCHLGVMRPCLRRIVQIRVHSPYTSNLFMFMFTMLNQVITPFPRPLHYVCRLH
jgi:hypothetical protein